MSNLRDGELPSWPEVRMLLESPSVDSETKRALALRYFDNIEEQGDVSLYGFESREQFDELSSKHREELSISGWDTATESSFDGDVYDSYTAAREEFDNARRQEAQDQQKAIQEDKESLGKLADSASKTDAGVENSNEILDLGNSCVKAIGDLVAPYNRARGIVASQLPYYNLQDDVVRLYDEQRDVRFDRFGNVGADLTAVADAMADAWTAQDNRMATVFGDWTGQGQESAQSAWARMRHGEDAVEQALRDNANAVDRACASVADSCRNKVGWLQKFEISGGFQGVEWYEIDRLCDIAELGRNASDNDFKHFIQYMPPDLRAQLRDDCGDLEGELKDRAQEWAKQWLQRFCEWFSGYLDDFRKTCENVRTAVDAAWDTLNDQLADSPTDAFNQHAGSAVLAPGAQPPGRSGADGGGATDVAGGPGIGGGAAGPGSAGGGGSTASVPAMSSPPSGGQPAGAPAAGEPAEPGSPAQATDPVTGEPPEIDPGTSLTVTQGDRRLSMVEPNDLGEMTISVENGSGEPSEFTLDFTGGGSSQMLGAGQAAAYRPDEDGASHIEADGLAITARQPAGAAGPTLVTVDDGSGEPITYSLGAESPDGANSFGGPESFEDTESSDGTVASDQQTSAQGWFSDALSESAGTGAGVAAGLSSGEPAPLRMRSDAEVAQQGSAGLGTAPGGGGAHAAADGGASGGSAMGGMGMMGAGMAGAGGQGGEDQQRGTSGFLVDDTIFDIGDTAVRISGNIDDGVGDEVDLK